MREEVKRVLTNINPQKAQRTDGLPSRVVNECSETLTTPITKMLNQSLTGVVPVVNEWKMANVVPILKNGKKDDVEKRPVSLLSVASKMLERCVYDNIIAHIIP